jgi:hypothetical protein
MVTAAEIYLGNAGTASRFLATTCAILPPGASAVITGNARMKQRSVDDMRLEQLYNLISIAFSDMDFTSDLSKKTGTFVRRPCFYY